MSLDLDVGGGLDLPRPQTERERREEGLLAAYTRLHAAVSELTREVACLPSFDPISEEQRVRVDVARRLAHEALGGLSAWLPERIAS